jgi:nucleoside-diphosphate-sugar epimerase
MIILFGATTDIGRRLAAKLIDAGHDVRTASYSGTGDFRVDLSSGAGLDRALRDAHTVVSCAHAKFTEAILGNLPASVSRVVLTGSAWRYSKVPNDRADQVRKAEGAFLDSGVDGVMLHPAMIYGGMQENNIRRLIGVLRRIPFVPAPGGGNHEVQPIYVDDVTRCLYAAAIAPWKGPNVVAIGGEPMRWRDMVAMTVEAAGLRRPLIPVPLWPAIAAASILNQIGVRKIDPNVFRRFAEDVKIPLADMADRLGVKPISFREGISLAMTEWHALGVI